MLLSCYEKDNYDCQKTNHMYNSCLSVSHVVDWGEKEYHLPAARLWLGSSLINQAFTTIEYATMAQKNSTPCHGFGTYEEWFKVMRAWHPRPPAKAAEVVKTVWPPTEIQPVIHDEMRRCPVGQRAATQ